MTTILVTGGRHGGSARDQQAAEPVRSGRAAARLAGSFVEIDSRVAALSQALETVAGMGRDARSVYEELHGHRLDGPASSWIAWQNSTRSHTI
jgi:hypothetical protein